jgi:hypothetical protein
MWKLAAFLLAASLASAGDTSDPWEKVKKLKTGSSLRIYKTGVGEPIAAQSADVTERKLIVIIKDAETAINKSEIDHVDYQPPATKTKSTTYSADGDSVSFGSNRSVNHEGWQTIYQRTPPK